MPQHLFFSIPYRNSKKIPFLKLKLRQDLLIRQKMVLVLSKERWMLANLDSFGSYRAHLVTLLVSGRQNGHVKRSWSDINKILVSSNAVMPDSFMFINKINTLTPQIAQLAQKIKETQFADPNTQGKPQL
ncbi:hypothetical protein LR48_Vigan06g129500 [Vigna angularis]|uniref:Uncharacterized protein n=1 Tax=Phaseolus angularis TaxID=3914 RepID=A0A0L9UTZ6_PHAAN|nr:hypothetical protein LR48_Vigan06g129500 [Vigna angularis]